MIFLRQGKGTLNFFIRLLYPYRVKLLFVCLALLAAAIIILCYGYGMRYLIDVGLQPSHNTSFIFMMAIFCLLSVVLAAAAYVRTLSAALMADGIANDLKIKICESLFCRASDFFDDQKIGDMVARFDGDVEHVRSFIASSGAMALRSSVQFVGSIIFLLITSIKLTAIMIVVLPVIVLPILVLGRKLKRLSKENKDKSGFITAFFEESLSALLTIQIFNGQQERLQACEQHLQDFYHSARRRSFYRSLLISGVIALSFIAIAIVLYMGGESVLKGELTLGEIISFIFYAAVAAGSLNTLGEIVGDFQVTQGALERIQDLVQDPQPKELKSRKKIIHSSFSSDPLHNSLELEEVEFFYPTRLDKPALSHISLKINPGEHVAIVGASGSGKTTLFRLLLGVYKPQKGSIKLNGISFDQIGLETIRRHLTWVPQDPFIFNASIRANIMLASPHASEQEFLDAVKIAAVDEFVSEWTQAYETQVGERGVRLSGGQKQRIAIARAVLRNPTILMLDEATNALDAVRELHVQQALESIMKNRTTIVVAHRLATVQKADRIFVLDGGKIVEIGNHHSLMKENGMYAQLAQKQLIA